MATRVPARGDNLLGCGTEPQAGPEPLFCSESRGLEQAEQRWRAGWWEPECGWGGRGRPPPPTVYCKLVQTRLQLCNSLTAIYSRWEVCVQVPSDCGTCSGLRSWPRWSGSRPEQPSGSPELQGLHSVWRNQNQPTSNLSLMLQQHHQRGLTRLGGVKGRGLWAGPLPLRSFEGAQSEWSRRCCDLL